MDLIRQRQLPNKNAVLEQRFIAKILSEESKDFDQAQVKLMRSRGFETQKFYTGRTFNVTDNVLKYTHPTELRFIDMKTRQSKAGVQKKAFYKIHNAPLYGMANIILQRLSFEYTDRIKKELSDTPN
ncbi:hypothetical protein [Sediminibacter sp. Hel_I_10]|uniref:hypothetical protein n=1 Tax=Sediminibacter sp. Hel_I_10 TaxID=1392490 RepID=UPI00047DA448|nr:hypothetical protein [Sediminibacter sp. Hel_I_10]